MKKKPRAAVLMFPGTNCELEAVTALERNGFDTALLRWNEVTSLKKYNAIVLAGGFSFEDRGRSGMIASHDPAIKEVAAAAKAGQIVLGICNGAQVLVETGLVPAGQAGASLVSLAHNTDGYLNEWVTLVSPAERGSNAFNDFDGTIHCPIAHGEGRFQTRDAELLGELISNNQNAFCYADEAGDITPAANPNGSMMNLAGLTNPAGNVMALMPHPERCRDGDKLFQSIKRWIAKKEKHAAKKMKAAAPQVKVLPKQSFPTELFIRLQITDNERLSVEQALAENKLPLELQKYRFVGMQKKLSKKALEELIRSGDILNTEKESIWVRQAGKTFRFDKARGLVAAPFRLPAASVLATPAEDASTGTVWSLVAGQKAHFEKAISQHFFHHPAAMDVMKI